MLGRDNPEGLTDGVRVTGTRPTHRKRTPGSRIETRSEPITSDFESTQAARGSCPRDMLSRGNVRTRSPLCHLARRLEDEPGLRVRRRSVERALGRLNTAVAARRR
jgi:hypothetical protein